jgi:hypothetical protein
MKELLQAINQRVVDSNPTKSTMLTCSSVVEQPTNKSLFQIFSPVNS